jgi:hypothetical protein
MVMNAYMEHGGSGAAWDSMPMIPAPPGTSLGDMSAQGMLAEVAQALGLQAQGVYTPWATRSGDVSWDEIKNPDTNIALFSITDAQVNQAAEVTYGHPLPFVAVITKGPLTGQAVDNMWAGTAYKAYETQAVYRQDDAKNPPTITFLHWGERIDMSALPKQTLALQPRAASVSGSLVFAAQIPVQGTTVRAAPSTSFSDALQSQLVASGPVPPPPPSMVPVKTAAASAPTNYSLPIAVGLGAAVLGFVLWRKR